MVSQMPSLLAEERIVTGKAVKRLRQQSITPIHLYGTGTSSRSLQADSSLLRRLLANVGRNRPLAVHISGESKEHVVFVREIQFHPTTQEVLHADFYRVELTQLTRVEVPIVFQGESPAVRLLQASVIQALATVTVECLPMEVPAVISADISFLDGFDKVICVSDLLLPNNVKVTSDTKQLVAHVVPPKEEIEGEAPRETEVISAERDQKDQDQGANDDGGDKQ
jgi:large subunit ribosomal protein L25